MACNGVLCTTICATLCLSGCLAGCSATGGLAFSVAAFYSSAAGTSYVTD